MFHFNLPQLSKELEPFPNPKILLHPNIPKPLHGLNPRTIKGQHWWDEQRKLAYAVHSNHCWACGIHKTDALFHKWLEAHEYHKIDYRRGRAEVVGIVALCHACHNYIHNGRLSIQTNKYERPVKDAWLILHHGHKVLVDASLRPNPFALRVAYSLLVSHGQAPRYCRGWADEANLIKLIERNPMPLGDNVKWENWRLILDGQEYKPLQANFNEWYAHYNEGKLPYEDLSPGDGYEDD